MLGEIVRAFTGEGDDIVGPLVESRMNKLQVKVGSQVITTLDETMGSLLDDNFG